MIENLLTSYTPFGATTSLTKNSNYIISTVKVSESVGLFGMIDFNFETIVKIEGIGGNKLLIELSNSASYAISNHISIVKMMINKEEKDWSLEESKKHTPKSIKDWNENQFKNSMSGLTQSPMLDLAKTRLDMEDEINTFKDKKYNLKGKICKSFLVNAEINFIEKKGFFSRIFN